MTAEIEKLMAELITSFNKRSSIPSAPTSQLTTTPPFTVKWLEKAETGKALHKHRGSSYQQLVIDPEDLIVVYGFINDGKVGLGYNLRTNIGGQFPIDIVAKTDTPPEVKCEVGWEMVWCTQILQFFTDFPTMKHEVGDVVRVIKWKDPFKIMGHGIHQRTLEMGHFGGKGWSKIE